jgi:hypothetical protein
VVDFIMALPYHEIDLNEDPCIFPDCGHFLTKTNMDGIMDLKAYYEISAEENPTAVSSNSEPFSVEEIKVCPTCRGSLRSIARYGRIVRRAMLDEATKKFIDWSNREYIVLAEKLVGVQQQLSDAPLPATVQPKSRPARQILSTNPRLKQLHIISDWVNTNRYKTALTLWRQISEFNNLVRKEEQPFQRVAGFVQHAARQRQMQQEFQFDENLIQFKGQLQATALLLKCETVMFADFMEVRKELISSRPEIKLDVSKQMKDCEALVDLANTTVHPRVEIEAHIYFAHFCALARALDPDEDENLSANKKPESTEENARDRLKEQAVAHLSAAREMLQKYPSTRAMEPEVEAVEKMLRDGVFYAPVSAEEMKAVITAMAGEFRGTGHWYTCENGHPFTVGECGMPMEQARCPECGGVVGGRNHTPADGVRHAAEIENLVHGVEGMRV